MPIVSVAIELLPVLTRRGRNARFAIVSNPQTAGCLDRRADVGQGLDVSDGAAAQPRV
jgi:hypothetical protein